VNAGNVDQRIYDSATVFGCVEMRLGSGSCSAAEA
jgi:hypothetical protein